MTSLVSLSPTSEERGIEILARLRPVFAEKGFDGASMQDMARAAGMSVGNFYRYFPSKAAIVEAMVGFDLREIEAAFRAIMQSPDRMAALRATLHQRICEAECDGDGLLWAEITAAALRKPEIAAAAQRMETAVVGYLTSVFATITGRPEAEAALRYRPQAEFLMMLVKGSAMRAARPDAAADGLAALVLLTIDRTLSDISADAAKD
jgi:AcrR family transcriptional regulator